MSTDSYAVCRQCKRILSLDKFIGYIHDEEGMEQYDGRGKCFALMQWMDEHAFHGFHLVDEHSAIMDEDHHGWTYKDWRTGEERVHQVPERFRSKQ